MSTGLMGSDPLTRAGREREGTASGYKCVCEQGDHHVTVVLLSADQVWDVADYFFWT
jgi:hypothetical protein